MAIKIFEKFAPFANPADGDYPYGSIKNDSIPGAEDGTPLDAVWANDYAGFDAELFAQAGIAPSGQPDKLGASQRVDAILEIIANGVIRPKDFGVRSDGTEGAVKNHEIMQQLIDAGHKAFDFGGADNRYLFTGPVGLLDQPFYQPNAYYIIGSGAFIDVQSPTALFTSKTVASNGGIGNGSNTFSSKVFISYLNFIGEALNGVFDGDYLYNVHFMFNHCYNLNYVSRSYQNKGASYPSGYFQSVYISNNEFISCNRILSGKRAFNVVVTENSHENCSGGYYIDGNGQPAISNIRIVNNVFEGGGLFGSFGDTIGGVIGNNYFESNTLGDTVTKKCHIDIGFKNGSAYCGWTIENNTAQDSTGQIADTDFCMIGTDGHLFIKRALSINSNWTNSRIVNGISAVNNYGNYEPEPNTKSNNMPSSSQMARVDFDLSRCVRPVASNLSGSIFTIAKMLIPTNTSHRDCILEIDMLMKGSTSGLIDTCAASAKIHVFIAATGSGVTSDRKTPYPSVTANLVSFTQQPDTATIDTILGVNGTTLFTSPTLTVESIGDTFYLKMSGYSAQSVANYGPVTNVSCYATIKSSNFSNNEHSSARWIGFID